MNAGAPTGRLVRPALLALLFVLPALAVVRNAWLCDDAYITYRTVDNFVSGLGLRWNPAERVQSFTHPLWALAIAAGYAISGNVYWTALAVSLACSLLAIGWLVARLPISAWNAVVVALVLTFSSAFVDYSTSGLENPLTHLLLAAFLAVWLARPLDARNLGLLSGIAGLAALNRLDTLLLYAPALAFALVRVRSRRGLALAALGFAPLALWLGFALVYYGSPLPNTAAAKLALHLPRGEIVAQGLRYLGNSLRLDPVTLLAIVLAGGLSLRRGQPRAALAWAGAALYVAYVVRIGGDFMSGRMLTAPLVCAAALLARAEPLGRPRWAVPAIAGLLALGFAAPHPSFLSGLREGVAYDALIEPNGIADERRYYDPFTGIASYDVHGGVPSHEWARNGEQLRRSGRALVSSSYNGFFGFAAGPGVHIVDQNALSDAFLARLPPPYRPDWRIGHVWRELPAGYWETLEQGTNRIADPGLARLYEKIALVTRGEIWSAERWGAILELQRGRHDVWIDVNRYRFPPTVRLAVANLGPGAEPKALDWRGADVVLGEPSHAAELELEVGGDDRHALVFFRGDDDLAITKLPPRAGTGAGLARVVVSVPREAAQVGFDRVRVMPYGGDGDWAIRTLRLR